MQKWFLVCIALFRILSQHVVDGFLHQPSLLFKNRALTLTLGVKKAKRRRKQQDPVGTTELPDFEIRDEIEEEESKATTKPKKKRTTDDPLGAITADMMGSTSGPTRSLRDLISDRAIEKKIEFDEPTEDSASLPDLLALSRQNQQQQQDLAPLGKKKARRAARIAAAEAAKAEESKESIFSKAAVMVDIVDENGDVSGVKILEKGTWLGIYLLVGWEVYINSPLFERAQPMIPVVYDILV